MLIAVQVMTDAKCMTLIIGKVAEKKEEALRTEDSKKSAEPVMSKYPIGQAYA